MVCRTPGSYEISPLSISQDSLDLRDLNETYAAPVLRLVTVDDEAAETLEASTESLLTYEAWQYLPRETREHRVAIRQRQRAIAQRKQARRVEKLVFRVAAVAACFTAVCGTIHLVAGGTAPAQASIRVTVAPGDTLWTVASRYTPSGTATINTVAAIRSANPALGAEKQLRIGEQLVVPTTRG